MAKKKQNNSLREKIKMLLQKRPYVPLKSLWQGIGHENGRKTPRERRRDSFRVFAFRPSDWHWRISKGRIIEIFGPESSGKTTLALHAVSEAQKKGGRAAYVDAEHAIDPEYAQHLGVNIDELILSQPDSGEQALEIVEMLAESGAIDVIVVDSVAALVPQQELDGVMSDNQVGLQARLMSKAMRKLAGILSKTNCLVIFINQLREKVGVMYGNPETTTGGRALKFYASVRIDIRRQDAIKLGTNIIGNSVRVKIVKNKVAPPFKSCSIDIIYGQGISKEGETVDLGVQFGFIQKRETGMTSMAKNWKWQRSSKSLLPR